MAVKVNLRSEIGRVGRIVRVGGNSDGADLIRSRVEAETLGGLPGAEVLDGSPRTWTGVVPSSLYCRGDESCPDDGWCPEWCSEVFGIPDLFDPFSFSGKVLCADHHQFDNSTAGRGTARAEDAQGTPTQSHISPSILVYEGYPPHSRKATLFSYTSA